MQLHLISTWDTTISNLRRNSSRLCTIVLPWGKYEYVHLAMGVCNSLDIFQEQMSELMAGLEFVRVYIDDILCVTKDDFRDHLQKLEEGVYAHSWMSTLRINTEKSFFAKPEVTYLGFKINQQGIMPLTKKVEAILALKPLDNKKRTKTFYWYSELLP